MVEHPKPAALPADVLPDVVEQVARDRGRRLGVDAGAPAAALVTVLGSLVPAGNRLQMRQLDTEWTVKPIQWTAIIGPPGSNKSATINAAMGPVQKLEGEWRKSFASAEHKRKLGEARRATAEKATKTKPENPDQIFADEPEPEKPRFRQKLFNDATTEALAVALSENPEGLLYHADELAGWLGGMDAYRAKGGKDRAVLASGQGRRRFTINRKRQSAFASKIAPSRSGRNSARQDQGAKTWHVGRRAAAALRPHHHPARRERPRHLRPTSRTVERLAIAANAIADAANGALFRFSPEADAELHAVEAFKAKEIARPDASSMLRQWLDKMPNEFGRLSLVFHFIEHYGASGAASDALRPPSSVAAPRSARADI